MLSPLQIHRVFCVCVLYREHRVLRVFVTFVYETCEIMYIHVFT
ncbi:hypothetical protein M6B38_276470 [Iris pallida]|uniref:Uncharacterized protein n=1 Tax=Iris pallida TaxID=29817 RepID=A0AAX6I4M0_IRIPA|nr:hypothetical protein M6B38_276470 [Iris pallida]